jgi:cytochrome c oxidase subunit II
MSTDVAQHSSSIMHVFGAPALSEAALGWWLTVISCVVVALVTIALLAALMRRRDPQEGGDQAHRRKPVAAVSWIYVGVSITVLILIGSFIGTMVTLAHASRPSVRSPLTLDVTGHQWWWEVQYENPDPSKSIVTANEIHVPVGEPVQFKLRAADVIHSFWIPNLNGKRDLVPGYVATHWFRADTAGVYRGQCAEFCGLQHAKMAVYIIADPPVKFAAWMAAASASEVPPTDSTLVYGEHVFLTSGCSVCHSVAGTPAFGTVGPALSHFKSRQTIVAGTLANTRDNLTHWIANPDSIKPGVRMPAMPLNATDLHALVSYLETLK